MNKITKVQYEFALEKIEHLLPLVDDNTSKNDKNAIELSVMSEIVIAYEKEHYPMLCHIGDTFGNYARFLKFEKNEYFTNYKSKSN